MSNGFYSELKDRAVLQVGGAEAAPFLQGLITNDLGQIEAGGAIYAALLTPQGKILFDFFVARRGEVYLVDCAASQAQELVKRLTFYKLRAKVDIADVSDTLIVAAAWGDEKICGLGGDAGTAGDAEECVLFVDPRAAAAGVRFIGAATALEHFAREHGFEAAELASYHVHRIALGLADSDADIGSGELFPHETNLDQLHGVDFEKGCYVGQEVVSRTQHRAAARKRIVPVTFSGDAPAAGSDVKAGEKSIGTLLSGSGSRAIALIRLDRARSAIENGVSIEAGGSKLTLQKPEWASFEVPGSGA